MDSRRDDSAMHQSLVFGQDSLFSSLAEYIKTPFVQISYASELLSDTTNPVTAQTLIQSIALSSQGALRLLDNYLLYQSLQKAGQLALEPISLNAILYDAAHVLQPYATSLGCELRVQLDHKYEPVIADRQVLRSAFVSLGNSFIEAATFQQETKSPLVSFVVRRRSGSLNTGVFTNGQSPTTQQLQRAKALQGKAHQPMPEFMNSTGVGMFIADALFSQLNTTMKVAQDKGLRGLAATFLPSQQLQLV